MPAFRPPLGHTSSIPIPPPSAQSQSRSQHHLILHFFATFAPDEDTSGAWEIWSDLPGFNSNHPTISPPGEWQAFAFGEVTTSEDIESLASSAASSDEAQYHLSLSSTAVRAREHATEVEGKVFCLKLAIPAEVGTWSYTFRRVLPSGEVQWLGHGGMNGVVQVRLKEEGDGRYHGVGGKWEGRVEGYEDVPVDWRGLAIELKQDGTVMPHLLPTDTTISPHLVLASTHVPLHHIPFHKFLSSPLSSSEPPQIISPPANHREPTLHIAVAPTDLAAPLTIPAGNVLPEGEAHYSAAIDHLPIVMGQAISAAEIPTSALRLASFSSAGPARVSALIHSPEHKSRLNIVIYGYPVYAPTALTVTVPADSFGSHQAPALAVRSSSAGEGWSFVEGRKEVKVLLPAAEGRASVIGEVLEVAPFFVVPGRGGDGDDELCVAVLGARGCEVGKEEVDGQHEESKDPQLAPSEIDSASHLAEDVTPEVLPTSKDAKQAEGHPDAGHEASEETSVSGEAQVVTERGSWQWLAAIGRFFVGLWRLIIATFTADEGRIQLVEGGEGQDRVVNKDKAEEEEESQPVTPENEPAHSGLESADLSRATSSTAFSPLASPQSTTTTAPLNKVAPALFPLPLEARPATSVENVVQHFLLFTLFSLGGGGGGGARILLPPGKAAMVGTLRFSGVSGGGAQKRTVLDARVVKRGERRCVEVELTGMEGTEMEGGKEWAMRVERA